MHTHFLYQFKLACLEPLELAQARLGSDSICIWLEWTSVLPKSDRISCFVSFVLPCPPFLLHMAQPR